MTNEEAIEFGKEQLEIFGEDSRMSEFIRLAIEALEERPKGKWRSVGFEKGYAFCICSNCGKTTKLVRDSRNEFCCIADIREKAVACLYCGADMRGDV